MTCAYAVVRPYMGLLWRYKGVFEASGVHVRGVGSSAVHAKPSPTSSVNVVVGQWSAASVTSGFDG